MSSTSIKSSETLTSLDEIHASPVQKGFWARLASWLAVSALPVLVALYVAVVVVGGAVFGSRWVAQADPFEAYSTLVGRLSVFGRRADGTLAVIASQS